MMDKKVINVAFVGGGKGCYDILNQLKSYPPAHLHPNIIAVADIDSDAGLTDFLIGIGVHIVCVGVPIALVTRQFFLAASSR